MRTVSPEVLALLCAMIGFVGGSGFVDKLLGTERTEYSKSYGVDTTFPIHHNIDKSRNARYYHQYEDLMRGCYKAFGHESCSRTERDRMRMNLDQPKTHHNYTEIGFKHMKAPSSVYESILSFYNANKHKEVNEDWPAGNTYVNHWDSPTYMVSFENSNLRGGTRAKEQIWAAVKPIIEEWTGQKVKATSLYGIRVYKRGAVLATHVDRLPLVSSAIIQVAQDVDEPWPIEVYDHSGRAHNATMQPGDMLLYESHTVLHGRPFPLNGTFYANIFVHYEPIQHEANNAADPHLHPELADRREDADHIVDSRRGKAVGGHEHDNHVDPFRRKATAIHRVQDRVQQPVQKKEEQSKEVPTSSDELWSLVAKGDVDSVTELLSANAGKDLVNAERAKRWTLLHEAVRGGSLAMVELLVTLGARTTVAFEGGGNAWWLADRLWSAEHPISKYLLGQHE